MENWPTLADDNPRVLVNNRGSKSSCGVFHSEGVSTAATSFGGRTALVFPIILPKEGNIHPPNGNHFPWLQPSSFIDRVPPDNVPTRVIYSETGEPTGESILSTQGLGHQADLNAHARQVWESLLRHIWMFVFLVRAQRVQRLYAHYADNRAEDICLLEVDVDQVRRPVFNVLNGFTNMADF